MTGPWTRGGGPRLASTHHRREAEVLAERGDLAHVPALVPRDLEEPVDGVGGEAAGLFLEVTLERRVGACLKEVEKSGAGRFEDRAQFGGCRILLEIRGRLAALARELVPAIGDLDAGAANKPPYPGAV